MEDAMPVLTAIIYTAEEGGYWAEVPSLPGCLSEGDTLEEVKANIREAAAAWMETQNDRARNLARHAHTTGPRHAPGARTMQLQMA